MTDPIPRNKFVTMKFELPDVACESILSTAIEGGIGYWSTARNIRYTDLSEGLPVVHGRYLEDPKYLDFEVCDRADLEHQEKLQDLAGLPADHIEDMVVWHKVDYTTVRIGVWTLFSNHYGFNLTTTSSNFLTDQTDWLSEYGPSNRTPAAQQIWGGTMDADDCDVVVQLGLFGKLVYG